MIVSRLTTSWLLTATFSTTMRTSKSMMYSSLQGSSDRRAYHDHRNSNLFVTLPYRVPSYALLWAACHVQSQEGEGVTYRVNGGAGSADQGDVSHRGAEDLSRARAGQ